MLEYEEFTCWRGQKREEKKKSVEREMVGSEGGEAYKLKGIVVEDNDKGRRAIVTPKSHGQVYGGDVWPRAN